MNSILQQQQQQQQQLPLLGMLQSGDLLWLFRHCGGWHC
jgi:hypothetical protein